MDKYYVIVSHARFNEKNEPVHGTASDLPFFLERKRKRYIYLQHSLFQGNSTFIQYFTTNKKQKITVGFKTLPFLLRIVQEYIITFWLIFSLSGKRITFIGIDPLNAFVGVFFKKIGWVNKVIFYTADYAKKRYANYFLNKIYHFIDSVCIQNADQIWNVSSRITALRKEQGVLNKKNFLIPNAPFNIQIKKTENYEKYSLVIVTHITKAIDFDAIILAIKRLKKKYKAIKLLIIGEGPYKKTLSKKIISEKLSSRIIFTGSMSHDTVMKLLSQCGIGLAIYTNDYPWTWYGDSMKAREYLACGLPVIISDIPSTADDIKNAKAGMIIKTSKDLENSLDYLFSNEKVYAIMRNNARLLAKKYSFDKSLKKTKIF